MTRLRPPFLAAALLLAAPALAAPRYEYPAARRDAVVDEYFGVKVADPYRWLESADGPETRRWISAENALTRKVLDGFPGRAAIKERLTRIWDFPRSFVIERKGSRYFFQRNDGLQNQNVLYWLPALGARPKELLDPNRLSPDGTVAVTLISYSWDGERLAYALSSKGSDWQELRVRNVADGRDLPDTLRRLKFSDVAWSRDGRGFFYNRYPDAGTVAPEDENRYNRVYWHALGTPQSQDALVYERPDRKDWMFEPWVTEDGKYLVLTISEGTDPRSRIYYRAIGDSGPFSKLFDGFDARYRFVHNDGSTFYVFTDSGAPKGRVVAVDVRDPSKARVVVPEGEDVIVDAMAAGNRLAVSSLKDAHSRLRLFALDGTGGADVELPELGSLAGLTGEAAHDEFFYGFMSFLHPIQVYRYDLKTDRSSLALESKAGVDVSPYETEQVFVRSKDGTRVPMFLVHRKGLARDGSNPALLYAYGGFKVSVPPSFSISRLLWLENGGVFALANLRGGNEYGESWHRAGMLDKKQNVFDDFIAAGEWLVENKLTRADRLAIQGGSNGGLLVAAAMLQRPALFGAVLCQVPVTDMLRFQRFTVGHMWVPEYGSADASADQFRALLAYSPLHNVREGAVYPPILVTAADADDRVVPSHARKFVATLQHADAAGLNPILLRFDVRAGHGGGKPTAKLIEEQADLLAFLFQRFGMSPKVK